MLIIHEQLLKIIRKWTLLLNASKCSQFTLPVGLAQASVIYEAEVSQARALIDDRKHTLKQAAQEDPLKRLYLDNTLTYVQKQTGGSLSYQHQLALALVEEQQQGHER